MAEENTYPILMVNNTDISALESTQTSCTATDQNNQERPIKKSPDETVTKSNKHCLWKIEVKFEDLYNLLKAKDALNTSSQGTKPGSTPTEGVYLVQWLDEDQSGNFSEFSQ